MAKTYRQLSRQLEAMEKALELAEKAEKLSNSKVAKQNPGILATALKAVVPILLDVAGNLASKKIRSAVLKDTRRR